MFSRFITNYLNKNDPQHRRWYISTRQENQNTWINQGDGSQMLNLQQFFLKSNEWGELEQVFIQFLSHIFTRNFMISGIKSLFPFSRVFIKKTLIFYQIFFKKAILTFSLVTGINGNYFALKGIASLPQTPIFSFLIFAT